MSAKVYVLPLWTRNPPGRVVNTVSRDSSLSPFRLGPCRLYDGYESQNMENGWQYSKVYREFARDGEPTVKYFQWAETGWANKTAVRYPMGKGRKPLYSWWNGEKLDYVPARKCIYAPLYIRAVLNCGFSSPAYDELRYWYEREDEITLLDYDAYDHRKLGMSLTDVLKCPTRKMGHAFVLMMLLTGDKALKQLAL